VTGDSLLAVERRQGHAEALPAGGSTLGPNAPVVPFDDLPAEVQAQADTDAVAYGKIAQVGLLGGRLDRRRLVALCLRPAFLDRKDDFGPVRRYAGGDFSALVTVVDGVLQQHVERARQALFVSPKSRHLPIDDRLDAHGLAFCDFVNARQGLLEQGFGVNHAFVPHRRARFEFDQIQNRPDQSVEAPCFPRHRITEPVDRLGVCARIAGQGVGGFQDSLQRILEFARGVGQQAALDQSDLAQLDVGAVELRIALL